MVSSAYINTMTNNITHSTFDILKARLAVADWSSNARAAAAVILGCLAAGLLTLRIPEHKAFHRARVRVIEGRIGSKRGGIRMLLDLPDGRQVWLASARYNALLKAGAEICVHEMRDALRGGAAFELALPARCAQARPVN